MAMRQETRDGTSRADGANGRTRWQPSEASVGELLRRLGDDASLLVREEIALAKMELRQSAQVIATDLVKVAAAAGLAAAGGLALTAFLVLVIGALLGDAYWAGALIVGAFFLLVGGVLVKSALSDLRSGKVGLDDTLESLQRDRQWAEEEAQEFKRELRA